MLRNATLALPFSLLLLSACSAPEQDEQANARRELQPGEMVASKLQARPAADQPAPAPTPGEPLPWQQFRCGDAALLAIGDGDQLLLQFGDSQWQLQATEAASGARYQAAEDSGTWFWNKGERAQLSVGGQTYPECTTEPAGELMPAELHGLAGGRWLIQRMGTDEIPASAGAYLQFAGNGALSGASGCNSFQGRYGPGRNEESLRIGALAGTLKACAEDATLRERNLHLRLARVSRFHMPDADTLRLSDEQSVLLLLTRQR